MSITNTSKPTTSLTNTAKPTTSITNVSRNTDEGIWSSSFLPWLHAAPWQTYGTNIVNTSKPA